MATELRRRPITVEEYHRMLEAGILEEGERVELLRGDLVRKVTIGDRHRLCVNRLTEMLVLTFHGRARVQVQNPVVVLDDSEPEPDVALLKPRHGTEALWQEYPKDVFALVEVSDHASRRRDLRYKRALYAEAGIGEYWIVDLVDDVIRVNRGPDRVAKRFRTTAIAHPGKSVAFEAFPHDTLSVDEILGPRADP